MFQFTELADLPEIQNTVRDFLIEFDIFFEEQRRFGLAEEELERRNFPYYRSRTLKMDFLDDCNFFPIDYDFINHLPEIDVPPRQTNDYPINVNVQLGIMINPIHTVRYLEPVRLNAIAENLRILIENFKDAITSDHIECIVMNIYNHIQKIDNCFVIGLVMKKLFDYFIALNSITVLRKITNLRNDIFYNCIHFEITEYKNRVSKKRQLQDLTIGELIDLQGIALYRFSLRNQPLSDEEISDLLAEKNRFRLFQNIEIYAGVFFENFWNFLESRREASLLTFYGEIFPSEDFYMTKWGLLFSNYLDQFEAFVLSSFSMFDPIKFEIENNDEITEQYIRYYFLEQLCIISEFEIFDDRFEAKLIQLIQDIEAFPLEENLSEEEKDRLQNLREEHDDICEGMNYTMIHIRDLLNHNPNYSEYIVIITNMIEDSNEDIVQQLRDLRSFLFNLIESERNTHLCGPVLK